jgi:hypothetical protein
MGRLFEAIGRRLSERRGGDKVKKPSYITLYHSMLLYTTLSYSILLYTTLSYSILLYTTLYYSILLYTTLCYSMLLYTTLYEGYGTLASELWDEASRTRNTRYFTKSHVFYPHLVNYHAFFCKNRIILHQISYFSCTFGKLSVSLHANSKYQQALC